MKKGRLIGTAIVVVALGAGAYLFLGASSKKQLSWETAKVSRGTIANMVTATGTVEPITQVEVGTQVSGIINKIYVDYNSIVKKGQVIAELDKTTLESELQSKQADLESSRTEYEYQTKNYTRTKTLHEKNLVSDTDYESAIYQYEKAKSAYEKNQADLVKVKTNLGYAIISSPVDGVVLSRAVEEGQTVAASFSTPTLFKIANDLTKMQVVADVDEADIGQVEDGQRVTFTVDAYPNDLFEGEVMQVRLEATTTSNVVTYEVVINAPNPELKLKPGLTANVTIYTLEENNILTLPSKALRYVPNTEILGEDIKVAALPEDAQTAGVKRSVWVKDGQVLREKAVTVGITNGAVVELKDGLAEGEEVITGLTANQPAVAANSGSEGESSPFMPKRPDSQKKSEKQTK